MKAAQFRPLAEQDLVERTRNDVAAEDAVLGERFFDEAIASLRSVEDMPGIGSPLVGELIGVDGLRRIGVTGFPCGWFYIEREHLDVIQLLADKRDLDDLLGGETLIVQTTKRPHSDHDWAVSRGTRRHEHRDRNGRWPASIQVSGHVDNS